MIFEALAPLTLNTKTKGVLQLKAGDRMDVSARAIAQIQAQVPDKIRVLAEEPTQASSRAWVDFFSPLFGVCTARVLTVTVDEYVITDHSVLKDKGEGVTIPASWILDVHQAPVPS